MGQEGLKFYRCNVCGNLFLTMVDPNVIPTCCESPMEVLKANSSQGAAETHVPFIEVVNGVATVKIGMDSHPMMAEHRIDWIALEDGESVIIKRLSLTSKPLAEFYNVRHDSKLRAYAFCNVHGLWTAEK